MGWTKRQFVEQAFEEIGLAAYVFDLTPDQMQSALRRLDAMVAGWNATGIRIGWPMPSSPMNSDIDVDTAVPDSANEAIYLNLALSLAPSFGKVVSPETKINANSARNNLLNHTLAPTPECQFPGTLPLGAGAKPWRGSGHTHFIPAPGDHLQAGEDSKINFE